MVQVITERPARPIPQAESIEGVDDGSDGTDWEPTLPPTAQQDQWKQPVRVATTAPITISTGLNAGDTIDGVTLVAGDRVLVKDQSSAAENGIYLAGATPARSVDMDEDAEVLGAVVYVIAGTVNAGTTWAVDATAPVDIGTDAMPWASAGGGVSFATPAITYGTPAEGTDPTAIRTDATIAKPTEADLDLSDNTTNDASDTQHGFLPKLPDDPALFLDGQGNFNNPAIAPNAAALGFRPYAAPFGVGPSYSGTINAAALTAAGGARYVPVEILAPMYVQSVSVRNTDTGTQRSWNWHLYYQPSAGSATCTRVATGTADETFTPGGAASTRTINASGAPVLIAAGLYYLVIQNRHATNTFGLGHTPAGTLAVNQGRNKAAPTNPMTSSEDLSSGWGAITSCPLAFVYGRVLNEGGAF